MRRTINLDIEVWKRLSNLKTNSFDSKKFSEIVDILLASYKKVEREK